MYSTKLKRMTQLVSSQKILQNQQQQDVGILHGPSYHPLHIFKDVIISEAVRLHILNERQEDYLNSTKELKDKCLSSGFNKKVIQTLIQKVSTWTERFGPTNQKKQTEKNPIPWATSFPQFLQLTDKEPSI